MRSFDSGGFAACAQDDNWADPPRPAPRAPLAPCLALARSPRPAAKRYEMLGVGRGLLFYNRQLFLTTRANEVKVAMSQRNPLNDRYMTDEHRGQTRKSAASAKPKSKAAASVRAQPKKTDKEKKAERKAKEKAERAKRRENNAKYYNPPTERYKKLRRWWWISLVGAIICTIVAFAGQSWLPTVVCYVILALAYAFAIGAIVLDFTKIRKERERYQEMVENDNSKEARAAQKEAKRIAAAAAQAEAEQPKPTLKGFSVRKKKQEVQAAQARATQAALEEQAAQGGKADGGKASKKAGK